MKFRCRVLAAGFWVFVLGACTGANTMRDDPLAGGGQALAMVPISHANRYAVNIFVDKYWAGDADANGSGGGAATCCFPGMKDWSKPVTVTWEWGREENPETGAITMPGEKHGAQVSFPVGGPHQDPDWHKSDAYLCVILRDRNTAELEFSPSRAGCLSK